MTNPQDASESQNVEATEASHSDAQAAAVAAIREFASSIDGAAVIEAETEAVPAVPPTLGRSIQTAGRRKRAVACVVLTAGSDETVCSGRELEDYFPNRLRQQEIKGPLVLTEHENQFNIKANTNSGDPSGQAGALRPAIARALNGFDPGEHDVLKEAGFLTCGARTVERRKASLHKAHRAPQYPRH